MGSGPCVRITRPRVVPRFVSRSCSPGVFSRGYSAGSWKSNATSSGRIRRYGTSATSRGLRARRKPSPPRGRSRTSARRRAVAPRTPIRARRGGAVRRPDRPSGSHAGELHLQGVALDRSAISASSGGSDGRNDSPAMKAGYSFAGTPMSSVIQSFISRTPSSVIS